MHRVIFTFTDSGDYDQALTNIIVLNVVIFVLFWQSLCERLRNFRWTHKIEMKK